MRAVVIGILALFCGGCAAPSFDLVSRDPGSPWLVGERWVRTESSGATVSASFDGYWLDHLIFEVEVVNQSDAPLIVDPRQFSFTLASSGNDLSRSLSQRFPAEDPDRVRARLERATPGGDGLDALMFVGCVAVVALAVLAGTIDAAPNQDSACMDPGFASGSGPCVMPQGSTVDVEPEPVRDERTPATEFERERDRSIRDLLARTELAPGQSVRGEVWLTARPLRKVLGSEWSEHGHGITATPPGARADHVLTLRTPDALGGQEIDYSIAAEY